MKKLISGILVISIVAVWAPVTYAANVGAGVNPAVSATDYVYNAGEATLTATSATTSLLAITTAANDTGTLAFTGATTTLVGIGANAGPLNINTITIDGTSSPTFGGDIFIGGNLALTASGASATFSSGVDIDDTGSTSSITNTSGTNSFGTVTFVGSNTVDGSVGGVGAGLLSTTFSNITSIGVDLYTRNATLAINTTGGATAGVALVGGVTVFAASGTISSTVSGSDTNQYGWIDTIGNITVPATSTVNLTVTGYVANASELTIVNGAAAGGGVADLTAAIVDSSATLSFTQKTADNDDLIVIAARTNPATTSNGSAVAGVINGTTPTGDFLTVAGQLDRLSTASAFDSAANQLTPSMNSGVNSASFDTSLESIGALNAHLSEIASGGSAGTGAATGDFWTENAFWVKGFGAHADQDNRGGVDGYKADLWGAVGGIDGEIADSLRLGFSGGYANTGIDNKIASGGGTDLDTIQGTVYLNYDDPSPWYGTGGFSFGWNMYEGTRNIAFGTLARSAKSDYDGQQYTGFGEVGYIWKNMDIEPNQEWNFTPLAGLTYSHLDIDSYTETEAGSLNLAVASQDYDLLQSSLGLKIDRPWTNENGKFVPEIHAKWLYDFIGDEAATSATFVGGGSSFSSRGADPAQHSFNVGAGLTFYSKGSVSVSGTYDLEAKEDYISHTGQGVLRVEF